MNRHDLTDKRKRSYSVNRLVTGLVVLGYSADTIYHLRPQRTKQAATDRAHQLAHARMQPSSYICLHSIIVGDEKGG